MRRTEPIKAVRGVRDILPAERGLWRVAEQAAHRVARSFGYREIKTPLIEHAALIERVGEDTDAVAKELYRFEDRGGRLLALRPEATAGVVRAYFEGGLNQGAQPARLYLIGPMFRYDRPQKGRYRQFFQFDIEAIGASSPALDVEVIEVARAWLLEVGLSDVTLDLNSIGDDKCRPAYLDLLRAYYRPLKDKLHGDCQRRLEVNPLRLLDCKVPQDQPFKAGAPRITDHLCEECQAAWNTVRSLLDGAGIKYNLNPYLVRGLDYYTRTVFEFYPTSSAGQQDTVVAGGRYDGLASALGWDATPGVGFAGGLDRVTELMSSQGEEVIPEPAAEVVVLPDGDLAAEAAEVARLARGVRAVVVDYEPRSLRAKMRAADKLGVRWALLFGEEDAKRRVVQLRDMASGEQTEVPWSELRGQARVSGYTAPHCGSLRASDAGSQVELYGWVARRRDHGGLIFIDVRDRWGAVQVVFNPATATAVHAQASELRSEFVVRVKGAVTRRRAGAENPKMATGDIEVVAAELEVVNRSDTTPFPIEDLEEPDEKTRLEFRYLDLRRPRMTRMLELRSRVNSIIRGYMEANEFVEVETPILTRSSPSGARDFLVPSRLHPGSFYALPQAPQMLKQLLMVSGVQRYYQIARCFRDENLRADRQPEFTQLDLEMSFCDEEDVFTLIEGLFHKLWHEVLDVDLPVPFPRLDIKESLLRYGSDKPDLRYELEIADLGQFLSETRAEIFRGVLAAGGVVRGLSVPGGRALARRELDISVAMPTMMRLPPMMRLMAARNIMPPPPFTASNCPLAVLARSNCAMLTVSTVSMITS